MTGPLPLETFAHGSQATRQYRIRPGTALIFARSRGRCMGS